MRAARGKGRARFRPAARAERNGRFESRLAEVRIELLRRMLAAWASMMILLMGTLFAVLRTR